jgi:hypothetical protein
VKALVIFAFFAVAPGAAAFAHSAAMAQEPEPQPSSAQSIVVTGRRIPPRPMLTPVGYFRELCFDSNRLTGRSAEPRQDPNWDPLRYELRQKLGIPDAKDAYELTDKSLGYTLVLKTESLKEPDDLLENRCSIIVVGGDVQRSLIDDMSALLRAKPWPGRVDGEGGLPHLPEWHHWLWTAMPSASSKSWNAFKFGQTIYSGWITVLNPIRFYFANDYLLVDVKTKIAAAPQVSIISLAFIRRPDHKPQR